MKNYFFFLSGYLLFFTSCTKQLILRKSYFKGKENTVNRVYEYNLKANTVSFKTDSDIEVKKIFLNHKDYKFIYSMLNKAGIKSNYCWTSNVTYPKYSFKYEIIFDERKKMSQCTTQTVKYEIYDSFNKVADTIRKKITIN